MDKRIEIRVRLPIEVYHYINVCVELGAFPDAGACVEDAFSRVYDHPRPDTALEAFARKAAKSRKKSTPMTLREREALRASAQLAGIVAPGKKTPRRDSPRQRTSDSESKITTLAARSIRKNRKARLFNGALGDELTQFARATAKAHRGR